MATALIGQHRTGLFSRAALSCELPLAAAWRRMSISHWMPRFIWARGIRQQLESGCWFILFPPDYLFASSAASESKYSAQELPRAAHCTEATGIQCQGGFTLSCSVLCCQLLPVHSQFSITQICLSLLTRIISSICLITVF